MTKKFNQFTGQNQAIVLLLTKIYSKYVTETGFQTDTLKSLNDWLTLSDSDFDWLRAPSTKHQFENRPKPVGRLHGFLTV